MQRESGDPMRSAFSMITAIFVIVLMATVAVFILNISAKSVKATVLQYRHEQAILYARSYTELAVMGATANASLTTINGTTSIADGNYTINVTITDINKTTGSPTSFILIDVDVSYTDNEVGGSVTYHKRTLQKL